VLMASDISVHIRARLRYIMHSRKIVPGRPRPLETSTKRGGRSGWVSFEEIVEGNSNRRSIIQHAARRICMAPGSTSMHYHAIPIFCANPFHISFLFVRIGSHVSSSFNGGIFIATAVTVMSRNTSSEKHDSAATDDHNDNDPTRAD